MEEIEIMRLTAELYDTRDKLQDTRVEMARAQAELQDTRDELTRAQAELQDTRDELTWWRVSHRALYSFWVKVTDAFGIDLELDYPEMIEGFGDAKPALSMARAADLCREVGAAGSARAIDDLSARAADGSHWPPRRSRITAAGCLFCAPVTYGEYEPRPTMTIPGWVAVAAVVVLVLVVCLALLLRARLPGAAVVGGGAREDRKKALGDARARLARASENIVVDTLNLVHWHQRSPKRLHLCDIVATIEDTAPLLKERYPGRVVYVTKDRDGAVTKSETELARSVYQATARRQGVYVHVVEKGDEPLKRGRHSTQGRDDFYLALLAKKYTCPVISFDRFRDLDAMKHGDLPAFRVFSYAPSGRGTRDFVTPSAPELRRLPRPARVAPDEVFELVD